MLNLCRSTFAAVLLTLGALSVQAAVITVDPDSFANNTDISNAFSGVTLSAIDGGSNVILTPSVFSLTSGLASTGTQVFGHDGIFDQTWANGLVGDLRVDFAQTTDFVSIDIIANNGSDPGFLRAFDASDTLLGIFVTDGTLGSGIAETATISLLNADISYIIASGLFGNDVALDNLQYNLVAEVSEPATLSLMLIGLAGVGFNRKRKFSAYK